MPRGRPKQSETRDSTIAVRLTGKEKDALTEFRRQQPDLPSESEAVRRVLVERLRKAGLL